jgi:uncharacterized protein RhaS with RHS repeats
LGLYYYKARMYSPGLGRFLQTDPVGTADDLNLYAYVDNNPINLTDPTGLTACADKAAKEQQALRATLEKERALVGQSTPATMQQAGKIGVPTTALNGALAGATAAPNFIVSPAGTAFPVPRGATGPSPVINPSGNQTGVAFTGGNGGANGQVSTMRIMGPTDARGSSPGYPDGYIKYENSTQPKPQGVDPYTGKTLPNSQSHFPITK